MRIVFSRKGFDSQFGGVPNAVLPGDELVPFPIRDGASPVRADRIQRCGEPVGEMVAQLTGGRIRRNYRAHLDPDLDAGSYPREPGWRPVLGQRGSPLGHLLKQKVGVGDLFLFFGWFRRVERVGTCWTYARNSTPAHVLWGWLSVERLEDPKSLTLGDAAWLSYHPHVHSRGNDRHRIFVARERLNLGGRFVPGAGIFPSFAPSRVLSAYGQNMSVWSVPDWMQPSASTVRFSYIHDARRWKGADDGTSRVQTIGKGQEIVMTVLNRAPVDAWLASVFEDVPALGR